MSDDTDWENEPRFWGVAPVVTTDDVEASATYYSEVLGFKIDDAFSGPDWCVLWADQCQLFVSLRPGGPPAGHGQPIAICTPGVDDSYELHRSNGAKISAELEDKEWGLREYTVEDPNGYQLRFYSHIETQYLPWRKWKDRRSAE